MTTRLVADFLRQRVFTLHEVKERYGLSDHAAWQAVLYAKRRGQVGAVRRGLYYVVPPDADADTYRPDAYLVAAKANPEGLLAYHAALDLHGVAYSAFHEIAMATDQWRRGFDLGDIHFRFVEAPTNFGAQAVTREGVTITVADRERTLVDCCDRPAYAGGFEELLRSVGSFPSVDHATIVKYVRRYGRASLAAKVGWLLTRFSAEWGLPDPVRDELHRLVGSGRRRVRLVPDGRFVSDREWGVLVPTELEARLAEL